MSPRHGNDPAGPDFRQRGRAPIVASFMERVQQGQLDGLGNGHVVLHGVQGAKHQVEHAHRVSQLFRQLLDHYRKAACSTHSG